jgi:NaMN:DMB phosphoribosyltransferase
LLSQAAFVVMGVPVPPPPGVAPPPAGVPPPVVTPKFLQSFPILVICSQLCSPLFVFIVGMLHVGGIALKDWQEAEAIVMHVFLASVISTPGRRPFTKNAIRTTAITRRITATMTTSSDILMSNNYKKSDINQIQNRIKRLLGCYLTFGKFTVVARIYTTEQDSA